MTKPITFAIPPGAPVKACRTCKASIVWVVTPRGVRMPVEASGIKRGESHFAHCAQADMWRKDD
jgi:hypothetical protein